jgi:hypothetical protein
MAAEYRRLTVEWAAASYSDPKAKNRLFDQRHRVQKVLAASPEGQAALSALMVDDDLNVQASAAAHSLRWAEARARKPLVSIRDQQPQSEASLSAKYVLREHEAGRLSFDY